MRSHSASVTSKQGPHFGDSRVVEQYVEPSPQLVGAIEHALDVGRFGDIRLDGSLPKLVGKGLLRPSPFTSANSSRAPSRAKRRADAAPMPLAAPVMST